MYTAAAWETLFAAVGRRPTDDLAWSDLYQAAWLPFMDWILSRYGLDPERAGAVLQDAFMQYRSKLIAGRIARPSLSHLRVFVRYCVLKVLRDRSRLVSLDEIATTARSDPEEELLQKLMIDQALDRLDQRCSYLLRSRYFLGHTSAEIGAALRLETGYVDVLLHRCRSQCREILADLTATRVEQRSRK
jgi:RNA polymerase sigma factor (sigma-70 family)